MNDGTVEFSVTDGKSIPEEGDSVDLVYWFDSLVHVERDVMASYLTELRRCLKPGRFAFIEHSNLGAYPHLHNHKDAGPYNCRGATVSAATMVADARERGRRHLDFRKGLITKRST